VIRKNENSALVLQNSEEHLRSSKKKAPRSARSKRRKKRMHVKKAAYSEREGVTDIEKESYPDKPTWLAKVNGIFALPLKRGKKKKTFEEMGGKEQSSFSG